MYVVTNILIRGEGFSMFCSTDICAAYSYASRCLGGTGITVSAGRDSKTSTEMVPWFRPVDNFIYRCHLFVPCRRYNISHYCPLHSTVPSRLFPSRPVENTYLRSPSHPACKTLFTVPRRRQNLPIPSRPAVNSIPVPFRYRDNTAAHRLFSPIPAKKIR